MVSSRSARTAPRTAPDTVSRSLLSTDLAVAATGPAATTTAARVDRPSRAWSTSLQHRRQQECDIRGTVAPAVVFARRHSGGTMRWTWLRAGACGAALLVSAGGWWAAPGRDAGRTAYNH